MSPYRRTGNALLKIHVVYKARQTYSVAQANPDSPKNMLFLKNPQFLPNRYETLSK